MNTSSCKRFLIQAALAAVVAVPSTSELAQPLASAADQSPVQTAPMPIMKGASAAAPMPVIRPKNAVDPRMPIFRVPEPGRGGSSRDSEASMVWGALFDGRQTAK